MTDKFKNKFRIPSARAGWWDYGWAGAYFITICAANRNHYFGEIENGIMRLSQVGVLADVFWHEIKNHAHYVDLGTFVVMPNHIHGILILTQDAHGTGVAGDEIDLTLINEEAEAGVETRHALSLHSKLQQQSPPPTIQSDITPAQKRFRNQGRNTVSAILGSYKSAVTKHANRLGFESGWQRRFHDHIIRNDDEYQLINDYIETNPQNWEKDKFYNT